MEYFKIMHDRQTQVCRQCLKSTHIYRECPEIVCHRCKGLGHFARNCEMGRERHTVEVEPAAEGITGADGGEKQEAPRSDGEEKQAGGVEEPATDVQTEGEEESVTGCSNDEKEVMRELHGENGDGRKSGTGEDGGEGGAGVMEEKEGPAEDTSKASMSKKRKKKNKIKESNAGEYKKEDVGSESGDNGGRGETGSDETSEPDGKRSYAGSKEKNEGTPVEEQSGNVKVEKGPDDGERVSKDVSAEAAKTALRHEKRQMDILRAMPDML
ncbi:uncharacterized protein LOC117535871 [Gymnodraco acuticeps]|uniref:Uncharacterized protein LOC117535871 n=1 Tax=Gymnodraco acuticeps TaxID=8218 RepID=A0A6P8SZS0_GYMAC|nr:uncharacterized protein LOC117535871 [Gymnodraco acuticeps]